MTNFFKINILLAIFSLSGLIAIDSAKASTLVWKATNNSGINIDDFLAVFAGTGGTITNAMIVESPVPGDITSPNGNDIDIDFAPGSIAPGAMFTFKFDVDFKPVEYVGGEWTVEGVPVAGVTPQVVPVPESSSVLSFLALGVFGGASTLKFKLNSSKFKK